MIKHSYWEKSVQLLIGLSSFKLAVDTYFLNEPPDSQIIFVSNSVDIFFNCSFIFEMFCKLVAHGFIMDNGSYLRDTWNQLDFFIVTASIIDMGATGIDIPVIKILRMLRVLRPLRFINHNI